MNNIFVGIYRYSGPVISSAPLTPTEQPVDNPADFFTQKNETYSTTTVDQGGHWLVAVVGQKGLADQEQVIEVYNELFPNRLKNEKNIGPFDSLDEIEMLMIAFCDKLQVERASLCSVVEYSTIIEDLTSLEINDPGRPNLAQILFDKTREIKLPESAKSKGFFGKIFH